MYFQNHLILKFIIFVNRGALLKAEIIPKRIFSTPDPDNAGGGNDVLHFTLFILIFE